MRQTTLAQSGAPGRVIAWNDFYTFQCMKFNEIFIIVQDLSTIYFSHFSGR